MIMVPIHRRVLGRAPRAPRAALPRRRRAGVSKARNLIGLALFVVLAWLYYMIREGEIVRFQVVSGSMEPTLQVGDVWREPGKPPFRWPVLAGDDEASLGARILVQEHRIYPQAIQWFAQGRLRLEGRRVVLDNPPPPSIDLNFELIGRRAVEQLLSRITHPEQPPGTRILVPPKLISTPRELSSIR